MGRPLRGLAAAAAVLSCTPGIAQEARCPADMKAIERHADGLEEPRLRGHIVDLARRPLDTVVHAAGGVEAYRRRLAADLEELQRDPAVSGNFHDRQLIVALYRQLGEAAACVLDPADPRRLVARMQAAFPVTAIGVVQKMGGWGSGVLVGPCLMVTNEHVVTLHGAIEMRPGDGVTVYIGVGGVHNGFAEWIPAELVASGGAARSGRVADDWALLRLDRMAGRRYGYVELDAKGTPPHGLKLWTLG